MENCGPQAYHPQKKLHVVFDYAASYQGVPLNSELLEGADLTNLLIGVLLPFGNPNWYDFRYQGHVP